MFPDLVERAVRDDAPIRLWIAGCSTGEEVYSFAMTLLDVIGARDGVRPPIQIFGTDVSERTIEVAKA